MMSSQSLDSFAPLFKKDNYDAVEQELLKPFFTNLNKSVYVPLIFAPELIGALCSRTSRAKDDLRTIYLHEYLIPFLKPKRRPKDTAAQWQRKVEYSKALKSYIKFLQKHSITSLFANPRARSFYAKWLAQYGDDSIAQMAGMHVVFSSLSQLAIKHCQDQRIGLAPIEKSTRYVDYSEKIKGRYQYYVDPSFKELGLEQEYRHAMDGLFETYTSLLPRLSHWLQQKYPQESASVVEKKAFDTLRGLLPTSTLSQVAFFGNGQSFEHLINRSAKHPLGEIRWIARETITELNAITPSFLRRVQDESSKDVVGTYQDYLAHKGHRVQPFFDELYSKKQQPSSKKPVVLLEYDRFGEEKVLAGMVYASPQNTVPWKDLFTTVKTLSRKKKQAILDAYLSGRSQRWQKVGRAFENVYVRFEVLMNIGGWRDLQRHRLLTQQRQYFTCVHGYDIPPEITEAGFTAEFTGAITRVEDLYAKVAKINPDLAQYCVTMAHKIRFMQWQNLRECFWEIELRTIPEGHPDYRVIEQEKFRLLEKVYPLITAHMRVNMGDYTFARRGQEEKIQAKLRELQKHISS